MVTVLYYKEKDTPEAQHGPWRSRATSSLRNSSGHRRHPVPSPPVSLAQEERLLGMWDYLSAFLPHQLKEDPVQGSVLSECKTQPGVGTQIRRQWLGDYPWLRSPCLRGDTVCGGGDQGASHFPPVSPELSLLNAQCP